MGFKFQMEQATREKAKLRLALSGPGGAGKTKSALKIGRALVGLSGKIAVADTEFESASKYAPPKGKEADNDETFDFQRIPIAGNYDPRQIPELIAFCTLQGVDLLIIDSMTHFWSGVGGFLEQVDAEVVRMKAKNMKADSFTAWKAVDPMYKAMTLALLSAPFHVICTLRAKTEYEKVAGDGNAKGKVQKIGMAPEMRDHFQYEMDIEGMLDMEHTLVIGKTRCSALDGGVFKRPGADVAKILRTWLDEGDAPKQATKQPAAKTGAPPTDEQRASMKASLGWLGVEQGQGAYVKSLNNGEMPETYEEFERVNVELARRVAAKEAAQSTAGPTSPGATSSTTGTSPASAQAASRTTGTSASGSSTPSNTKAVAGGAGEKTNGESANAPPGAE